MTSNTGGERQGLPTWAKVLIGLVVAGAIGVVIIVAIAAFFLVNSFKQAQDPVAIAKVADQIGTFQNPLPDGYKYMMGLNLAGIETLTVEHKPDEQIIFVIAYPKADQDANSVVERISQTGVNTGQTSAKFEKVTGRGTEQVAGEQMPYIVGTLVDKSGSHEGMFGCIIPRGKNKTVLIYAAEPAGTSFNLPVTKNFLNSIHSFN